MTLRSCLELPAGNASPLRIVQISDIHLLSGPDKLLLGINTQDSFQAVLEQLMTSNWPPQLIVLTGDLAQEPGVSSYSRLRSLLQPLEVPCVCLPGNHDQPGLMLNELRDRNVYCKTRVSIDDWQLICLDSSVPYSEGGHFSDETFVMLEDYLLANQSSHTLIFMHHHPLPIGSRWLDTMVLDNRDRFFEILQKYPNVRGIACGHIHQHVDTRFNGLRILGTPSSCFQFKPDSENFVLDDTAPGYRQFELYSNGRIETRVERIPELPAGLDFSCAGY